MPMSFQNTRDEKERYLNIATAECCGWVEVSGFYDNPEREATKKPWKVRVDEDLAHLTTEGVIPLNAWSLVRNKQTVFTLFAILTQRQINNGMENLLLKHGFKQIEEFFNPNTNNVCYLYLFKVHKPDGMEV